MLSDKKENQEFSSEKNVFDRYGRWAEEMLFHSVTGSVPSCRRYFHIDHEKAFDQLIQAFGADASSMIMDDMIHIPRKYQRKQRAAIFITPNMMAGWNNLNSVFEIYYVNGEDREAFEKADAIVKGCFSFGTEPSVLNLFIQDAGGLRLIEKEVPIQNQDLDKYYNDDLKTADAAIMEKLSDESQKGIVLLHGAKGSGKTSYLRSIISR